MGGALSVMTAAGGGEAVAAVSDEAIRHIEELQFSLGEGPSRDAFATGKPVLTWDMQYAFPTWPGYAPEVYRAGVGAAYAFPLHLGAARFGVLTLYARGQRALSTEELRECLIFAEVATEALLDGAAPRGEDGQVKHGRRPLHFRTEVYQAQGMVMVELEVSLAEALSRMRARAYSTGRELTDLAVDILAGKVQLMQDDTS